MANRKYLGGKQADPPAEKQAPVSEGEQVRAALSKQRGEAAAKIADPEARRKYVNAQGNNEAASGADDPIANEFGAKVLASYKKGGPVKKTGIYKLHGGERVLNAKQTKAYDKVKKIKKVKC